MAQAFGEKPQVGVLKLGVGNVDSVINALLRENILAKEVDAQESFDNRVLILPGVGHWSRMYSAIAEHSLDIKIRDFLANGGGLVGICLGMQALGKGSSEGEGVGLSLLDFNVTRVSDPSDGPSIGWAEVSPTGDAHKQEPSRGPFYFMHDYGLFFNGQAYVKSYYTTRSGQKIAAEVRQDRVVGFQFHPERSLSQGREKLSAEVRRLFE